MIEAELLDGLVGDARVQMRWSIHDPVGFSVDQGEKAREDLLNAGGEIG